MTHFARRRSAGVLTATVALFLGANAGAHDGHEHEDLSSPHLVRNFRTWTHASGRLQVRGTFVATHGDQIQVRREGGALLDIKRDALSASDRAWVEARQDEIRRVNSEWGGMLLAQRAAEPAPPAAPPIWQHFQPFADTLKLRWDDRFFYVESNGLPDHRMMVGITAWQQQVPLPQSYSGTNAWRIPLHPVPARRPMSAKENFFRGAIALAVNGVPIFNPIKNDGRTDTYLAGELDEFGGHCGRADDYHYHIAPVHLEPKAGKDQPLAYALDGYPIYGYDEPDGTKPARLDRFNGHEDAQTPYHYHASRTYPYLNGGFHGEVTERGGQVDPQPRAEPVREALPPLRGATITDFRGNGTGSNTLTYELAGRKHDVQYTLKPGGAVVFRFVDDTGKTVPHTYRRRNGPPGPPPRDEPPGGPPRRGPRLRGQARRAPAKTGVVTAFSTNPEGEIDGLRFEDGTDVRFRPDGGKRLQGVIAVKDRVTVRGWIQPGETEVHAATIEHVASGKVIPVDRPPPELQEDDSPRTERRDPDPAPPRRTAENPDGGFVLRSPAATDGGTLPREFTGDGEGVSPPLEWAGAPAGTNSFALIMHHEAPDGVKWYWVPYNIPGDTTRLPKNTRDVGTAGNNSINRRVGYAPPRSKGPGEKHYTLTLYALSAPPRMALPPAQVSRDALLGAMKGLILGTAALDVTYRRNAPADQNLPPRPGGPRPQEKLREQGQRIDGADRANARQTDPRQPPPFHTKVPSHPVDILLGRPTDGSVTLSIVSYVDANGFVAYGTSPETLDRRSDAVKLPAGAPVEVLLRALERDTQYHYRLHTRTSPAAAFESGGTGAFHTQRSAGQPFVFTIQADSHLDLGTEPDCYVRTLENALADHPDFHVELGDTFMTDKFARYTDALSQYRAQRYYFGRLCHSAPLFFVLGNHDGESGSRRNGTPENMAVWSANTRKRFFPNPHPDQFYSGNAADEPFVGRLGDYYAWGWGDALCVVLDPFWYTTSRRTQGNDAWNRTLGEVQYRWLAQTLAASNAKFKFVFIHHLVGGATPEARGGTEAAPLFEWGGHNLDGSWAFDTKRPGWEKPVHQLLVDHCVSAVFHGHDHFYARQERDGIVYQLVPQPGNPRYGPPRSAEEYGYRQGELRNGPGYLRVSVGPERATVDYVLSVLPKDERADRRNGAVIARYAIAAADSNALRSKERTDAR